MARKSKKSKVGKKFRASNKGRNMVSVAKLMFRKYKFGNTFDREDFEKLLNAAGRKWNPKSKSSWRDWIYNERQMLNHLGCNLDLLEVHNIEHFRLDAKRHDFGGGSKISGDMSVLDLRRPEEALIYKDQLSVTAHGVNGAVEHISTLSQSLPANDPRVVKLLRIRNQLIAVTSGIIIDAAKDQRVLIQRFPR